MENYTLNLASPWNIVKEKIKETNVDLTDADLVFDPANGKDLIERLAAKMGRSAEEVKSWIESVSANAGKAS